MYAMTIKGRSVKDLVTVVQRNLSKYVLGRLPIPTAAVLSAKSPAMARTCHILSEPPPLPTNAGTLRGRGRMHEGGRRRGMRLAAPPSGPHAAFGFTAATSGRATTGRTDGRRPVRKMYPCRRGLIYPSQLMGFARFGAVAGGVVLWATHPYGKPVFCDRC